MGRDFMCRNRISVLLSVLEKVGLGCYQRKTRVDSWERVLRVLTVETWRERHTTAPTPATTTAREQRLVTTPATTTAREQRLVNTGARRRVSSPRCVCFFCYLLLLF